MNWLKLAARTEYNRPSLEYLWEPISWRRLRENKPGSRYLSDDHFPDTSANCNPAPKILKGINYLWLVADATIKSFAFQRPKTNMLSGTHAAFDCGIVFGKRGNRKMCWCAELYRHILDWVRACDSLSLLFGVSSKLQQGFPVSPFLLNFVIEDFLHNVLSDLAKSEVELISGNSVCRQYRLTEWQRKDNSGHVEPLGG